MSTCGCWTFSDGRQVRKEIELLEHHSDVFPHPVQVLLAGRLQVAAGGLVPQVVVVHGHEPAVDGLQGHQYAKDGGLARTTGPDQGQPLAVADLQRQAVQDLQVTEGLGDFLEFDHVFHGDPVAPGCCPKRSFKSATSRGADPVRFRVFDAVPMDAVRWDARFGEVGMSMVPFKCGAGCARRQIPSATPRKRVLASRDGVICMTGAFRSRARAGGRGSDLAVERNAARPSIRCGGSEIPARRPPARRDGITAGWRGRFPWRMCAGGRSARRASGPGPDCPVQRGAVSGGRNQLWRALMSP